MTETNYYLDKLNADKIVAMRNKHKETLSTIRMVITDLNNERIKLNNGDLTKDQEEVVLNRYVKKLEGEIEEYAKVGRDTEKQAREKAVILGYLPKKATEEEITAAVEEAIVATGASTMKDMGKIMGAVKAKFGNNADMGFVNKVVKEKLS